MPSPPSREGHVTIQAVACPAVGGEIEGSSRGQLLAVKPVLSRSQADSEAGDGSLERGESVVTGLWRLWRL